jgi:hypothetical protein
MKIAKAVGAPMTFVSRTMRDPQGPVAHTNPPASPQTLLYVLSQQVVQRQAGVRPLRVEVRPTNPDLTPPCLATPMPA